MAERSKCKSMTTYESLVALIGNVNRHDQKLVRRYLTVKSQAGQPNKTLKLFDLLMSQHGKSLTSAQVQKRLGLARHHATFGRLVNLLRRRIIEALSLPVVIAGDPNYSERTKALFHYHRQCLKALILFEAGDFAGSNETLFALLFWTEKYELYAERMVTAEFLMQTIRIYTEPESLKYFKDVPEDSRRALTLISYAERIREMVDEGKYEQALVKFGELKDCIKGSASHYALFVLKGVEAKVAAIRGQYKRAEKLFFVQLGCCNHDAVRSEENRAQVYADIAQNSISLKKTALAKEYIDMALRCRRRYKTTDAQLEKLQAEMQPKE